MAQAQDIVLPAFRSNLRNLSSSHGDEGHEAREHDREGQEGPDKRLPWHQDEDLHRADQGQPDEEQEREDREQESERERKEGLRQDQGLDPRRDKGAQGSRREGIPRREEGYAPVQEGEGVLRQVSGGRASRRAGNSLRGVGLSRTLSER